MNICVTGASSGIGGELAKQLLEEGHTVWGIARRENLLQEMKNKFGTDGRFFYAACDVSDYEGVLKCSQQMKKEGFVPDVFILAAGIFIGDIKPGFNYEVFKKNININLYGVLNFVDIFLPEFLKKNSGQFVAISSANAFRPSLRGVAYPASKSALGISFRGLDLAYREKNVTFSTIYLGPVATDMWVAGKSFLVSEKGQIASEISKIIETRKSVSYIPFWSTLIFRLNFLSDRLYIKLTEFFRPNVDE